MARRELCFAERYGEHGLLGAAGLCAVAMLAMYGVRSPNRAEYNGRVVGPAELDSAILRSAERLRECVRNATIGVVHVPEYHKVLAEQHARGILCGPAGTKVVLPASLPRTVGFGLPTPRIPPIDPERDIELVRPLAPGRPVLSSGRSAVRTSSGSAAGIVREVSWVSVGGCYDTAAQREAFEQARYSDYRARVYVVRVELQRQARLADGCFSAWEEVEPSEVLLPAAMPEPVVDRETGLTLNSLELKQALDSVKQSPGPYTRPSFHEVVAGDPWQSPLPKRDRAGADDDELGSGAESGPVAVWAHDDTVRPGQTYRYRLRVNLWNRYVGRAKLLRHRAGARRSVVCGEWSEPSEAITVRPDVYFFVRGGRAAKQLASVEVWKWHLGRWVRQQFDVGVGDLIGGVREVKIRDTGPAAATAQAIDFRTGALVLAVAFDEPVRVRVPAFGTGSHTYRQTKSAVLAYRDPLDGSIKRRFAAVDRFDPLRRQLREP